MSVRGGVCLLYDDGMRWEGDRKRRESEVNRQGNTLGTIRCPCRPGGTGAADCDCDWAMPALRLLVLSSWSGGMEN
jgi:hypothetical protein